ncbi:MAG: demethylmenaquinone methyltransferase [Phycisphaeraceae bacterium]|nr:MAG: demethylmenaquinone methyltransferase [Phycisphaeraceae bacterium]
MQEAPPATPAAPAWTDTELADVHARTDKHERVRAMFGSIAGRYDLNNRVHSMWRDQAWRRHAVRAAGVQPGERVLDVACGTGDLTLAFAARSPAAEVVGVDFTPEMLELARPKAARANAGDRVRFAHGDAMALDFEDQSFDVLSIAFGIRNVQDPAKALAEFLRVLRPGGRLVILEFDTPTNPAAAWFNRVYCQRIMPVTATLLAGDRSGAYKYLPKSVSAFANSRDLAAAVGDVGFADVTTKRLTMGVCACTRAVRPA